MSIWLKKRVVMWCALVVLLGGAQWFSGVRAQGNFYSPPAKTPEAAAAKFATLLLSVGENEGRENALLSPVGNPISRVQMGKISQRSGYQALNLLMKNLADVQRGFPFKGKTTSQNGEQATVELEKAAPSAPPPVVCVAEDGGWRVDLFATYTRWLNLSDVDRDMMIAQLTGEVSPALAANPVYIGSRENARSSSCRSNLKQIGLGMMQYQQDYDEKMPPAREWAEVAQPYLKSRPIFHCPSVPDPKGFGYAYNARLAYKGPDVLNKVNAAQMVMIYETTDLSWNAYGLGEKPAFRHLDGANYLFLDGHVKWQDKRRPPQFTFQAKKP